MIAIINRKPVRTLLVLVLGTLLLISCAQETPTDAPPPPPPPDTPIPATDVPPTDAPTEEPTDESGAAARAVDLIGAWVAAGAPETDPFDYTGIDRNTYQATFEVDIAPLFRLDDVWFEGSLACAGCHFALSEDAYHEMDLSSYPGIRAGADTLEDPPGESLLGESGPGAGDFDWGESELRHRLRNNRMPPGWPFDISEENRDGPCVTVSDGGVEIQTDAAGAIQYGCDSNAVGLIGSWVEAGAPETDPFTYAEAALTFESDVLPFFTVSGMWFEGSQACTNCHFALSEDAYHEMDLSSYAGIRAGADTLEDPPGESLLGESEPGAGDFDWGESELRHRLRNNRMAPGFPFDITEENRDGPYVLHGEVVEGVEVAALFGTGECEVRAVDLIGAWVGAGAPETGTFDFLAEDSSACEGTFEADIGPLFRLDDVWFEGSLACAGCHFALSEDAYHEMDLSSYPGIRAGADTLEDPPGESLLGESGPGAGDFDWDESELRHRLRNNRMPPGWPFDISEENRDGPTLTINGTEVRAVDLIGAWVDAGVPETDTFGEYGATFEDNVLPLFNENGAWFEGSQACTTCHFANSEASYHEMNLGSYAGILAGADVLEMPPGMSLLGESGPGAGDFDWGESELRHRLRNNRMAPGFPFDITEENRDGPLVLAGTMK